MQKLKQGEIHMLPFIFQKCQWIWFWRIRRCVNGLFFLDGKSARKNQFGAWPFCSSCSRAPVHSDWRYKWERHNNFFDLHSVILLLSQTKKMWSETKGKHGRHHQHNNRNCLIVFLLSHFFYFSKSSREKAKQQIVAALFIPFKLAFLLRKKTVVILNSFDSSNPILQRKLLFIISVRSTKRMNNFPFLSVCFRTKMVRSKLINLFRYNTSYSEGDTFPSSPHLLKRLDKKLAARRRSSVGTATDGDRKVAGSKLESSI